MSPIRIEVLGGFRLTRNGETVQLGGRKIQALLCYLAMKPGEFHSRIQIASLLWGDSSDTQARQSLRQALSGLRRVLPESSHLLECDNENICMISGGVETDVAEFESLCKHRDMDSLQRSVDLYQGDFLAGFNSRSVDFENWISIERSRLRELAAGIMQKLMDGYGDSSPKDAVTVARRLLSLDSVNEEVHRRLMNLYMNFGGYNDAIRQYRQCEESLHRILGVAPDAQTQKLYQCILQKRQQQVDNMENTPAIESSKSTPALSPQKPDYVTENAEPDVRVLVVDDDEIITNMLNTYLTKNSYTVFVAADGEAMRDILSRQTVDVALLDIGLPGEDGLSLARYIREHHDIAIIMVTAADDVVDRIVGLEVGADDYVSKPFDPRELRARLKSVVRRYRKNAVPPPPPPGRVAAGDCMLDMHARVLIGIRGDEIPLPHLEFELLKLFTEQPYQILSRDELAQHTQNRAWDPQDRGIDIRIARLRRKIETDPDNPKYIKTVRGRGYMFVPKT